MKENKKEKESLPIQLKVLIIASIVMFFSLFTGSAKISGITLLLWAITVFWTMFSNFKRSNFDLFQAVEEKGNKITTKKGAFAYSFVIAMVVIGILTFGIGIFVMIFVM